MRVADVLGCVGISTEDLKPFWNDHFMEVYTVMQLRFQEFDEGSKKGILIYLNLSQ